MSVNNGASLKVIENQIREISELNRLFMELGEKHKKALIEIVELKEMLLLWEKDNCILQESLDNSERDLGEANDKIQELINAMIKEHDSFQLLEEDI